MSLYDKEMKEQTGNIEKFYNNHWLHKQNK